MEGFKKPGKNKKEIQTLYPFFFLSLLMRPVSPLVFPFSVLVKHVLLRDARAITFYIDCYWYKKSLGSGVCDTLGVLLSK